MTKPIKWLCAQRRLRSAWASAQSHQSSLCAQWVAKVPAFFMRTAKTLIRLGGCPGWSSLGARHFVGFVMRRLICRFWVLLCLVSWGKRSFGSFEIKYNINFIVQVTTYNTYGFIYVVHGSKLQDHTSQSTYADHLAPLSTYPTHPTDPIQLPIYPT